jgi:phosphoglycerate dehydrogenase-like enzyme
MMNGRRRVRFIATTGRRNAGIDIDYAKAKGVTVSGTDSGGNSTLEHIWALIMAVARNIVLDDANTKAGNLVWQTKIPLGLSGKTLGLIGVGNLGSQIAMVCILYHPCDLISAHSKTTFRLRKRLT